MGTPEPTATTLEICDEKLVVYLTDGRTASAPLEWYPRLFLATPDERNNWELFGQGCAIEWPDVDEHLSVESIIAGRRSGECEASLNRWLASWKHNPN